MQPRLFDPSVLEQLLAGNREMMGRFAHRFVESARHALAEIDAALAAQDAHQLRHLGHRTRSAALTVGAAGMAELCARLEQLQDLAAASPLVGDLHSAFSATVAGLRGAGLLRPDP
ncbi:Hpt domain-containing protein [Pseudoduganella sp. GCM10020061]|uniref:Hpt domain-containing protein n=1 Tax=Pseudoduganella sp. GCM10020061 TaxID=3317345 RepID=UPI00362F07AF